MSRNGHRPTLPSTAEGTALSTTETMAFLGVDASNC